MFGEFFEVVVEGGGRPLSMDKSIKWRKMTDWILINTRNWRINDERIKGGQGSKFDIAQVLGHNAKRLAVVFYFRGRIAIF